MISEYKEQTENVYKNAGERIFKIRNMRGYSRETLAELAGISAKFLYEIENGRKGFSAANLYYISEALKVNVDYILTGKEGVGCDKKLVSTLELFKNEQAESLDSILRAIYKLLP